MKYHISDYLNHVRGFSERGLTLGQIQIIRSWLTGKGFDSQLHIERIGERNTVYIRILLAQPVDVEAQWLFTIRSEHPSREKLVSLLSERMQVA